MKFQISIRPDFAGHETALNLRQFLTLPSALPTYIRQTLGQGPAITYSIELSIPLYGTVELLRVHCTRKVLDGAIPAVTMELQTPKAMEKSAAADLAGLLVLISASTWQYIRSTPPVVKP